MITKKLVEGQKPPAYQEHTFLVQRNLYHVTTVQKDPLDTIPGTIPSYYIYNKPESKDHLQVEITIFQSQGWSYNTGFTVLIMIALIIGYTIYNSL